MAWQWQGDLQNVNEAINASFIPIFFSLFHYRVGFLWYFWLLISPLVRSIEILECWSIFLNSDIEPCRIKIKVNNFYYKTQFSTAAIFVHGKTVNNKIKKFVHFLFWFFNIALIELLTSLFKYWPSPMYIKNIFRQKC